MYRVLGAMPRTGCRIVSRACYQHRKRRISLTQGYALLNRAREPCWVTSEPHFLQSVRLTPRNQALGSTGLIDITATHAGQEAPGVPLLSTRP
jgi:hypothetical protein